MATRNTTKNSKPSRAAKSSAAAVSVRRTTRTPKKTEESANETTTASPRMSSLPSLPLSRRTIYIILLALGLVVLLFAANKYLVIAWVDKKPVTAFEYFSTLSKRYGNDVSEELIVQKLLENEAGNKNVTISDEDLNAEIAKIEEQQGGADKLEQILQAQNISRDEFHRLVKLQLMRSKLFADGAAVSEADIDAYVEENKDAFAPTTDANGVAADPKSDPKLRDSIKEQLKQQKTNASFSAWLQTARQSDRVVKNW